MLAAADAVLGPDAGARERLHLAYAVNVVPGANPVALANRLSDGDRLRGSTARLLMLGTVNHPHVESLALAMADRGLDVHVAGDVAPGYPPSELLGVGIPVTVLTRPMLPWLRRLLKQLSPDIVHAHWLWSFPFVAAMLNVHPLVAMAWGSDVLAAGRWRRAVCRFTIRRADLVLADSEDVRERLVKLGATPARTQLVSWGVDLEAFSPPADRRTTRERLGLAGDLLILSPRALEPHYNSDVIIRAFERVSRERPGVQLLLKHLGSAPPQFSARLPPGARIVGHVPYELMPEYFRAAEICISIPEWDSSPRSIWEAMACGCACVVSDLPWVRELIDPNVHALVVSARTDEVVAALLRLIDDPAFARRIGEAGRSLVEGRRDRRATMDELARHYQGLVRE